MFCPVCGFQAVANAKFCASCGTALPEFARAAELAATVAGPCVQEVEPPPSQPDYKGAIRAMGFAIDAVCLAIVGFAVLVIAFNILSVQRHIRMNDNFFVLIPMVTSVLYFAFFESTPMRASPGKLCIGGRVVGLDGRRIGFFRALGRQLGKLLSLATLGIEFMLSISLSSRCRTLYDRASGTVVVSRKTRPEAVASDFKGKPGLWSLLPSVVMAAIILLVLYAIVLLWQDAEMIKSGALDDPKVYGLSAEPPK